MHIQSQDYENESDNDEGFIPSKIVIKENQQLLSGKKSNNIAESKQFIARHITEGIMRKQPVECYRRFSRFDFIEDQRDNNLDGLEEMKEQLAEGDNIQEVGGSLQQSQGGKSKAKEKLFTPYEKYIASGEYMLVYSRNKDFKFSKDEPNFAGNDIKLDCLRSTEEMKFKPIKPFEFIEQKGESILTQGMSRNSSVRECLLQFDSKFECGNLLCAFKHKRQPYCYTLFIQNDTNSYGYNQWFYFSVRKAETKVRYRFNIVNFRKRHSFFREGNRPVVFSLADSRRPGMSGYSKRGGNVRYGKSPIVKSKESKEKLYQLSFQLEFKNEDDLVYVSMGLPYSYSKLLYSLSSYEQKAKNNQINFQLSKIATSIAGNSVPYLTLTKKQLNQADQINEMSCKRQSVMSSEQNRSQNSLYQRSSDQKPKKKVILIMARQHPGETWSSYLMDEIINNLVSLQSPESSFLLQNFIIKIIPMINVDGVISGNFRCDLSGMDLNRNWKNPSGLLHPQIFSIKNQILNLIQQGYEVVTCFDLHGHSKQYNVFCYSCKTDNQECRILTYIFSVLNQQFYFPFCTFGISKYKQSTARAVIFNIIKNTNVLTIESSFFATKINNKVTVFQPVNFQNMARTLIKGCKSYFSHDQNYQTAKRTVKQKISQFLQYKSQKQDALSGSDSEPSADQIELMEKLEKIVPKNLIPELIEQKSPKKPVNRVKKNVKRKTQQAPQERFSKLKKSSYNSLSKNMTIDVVSQSPVKETRSFWQALKTKNKRTLQTRPSQFKKVSVMVSRDTIDQSFVQEQSRKKLDFKQMIDRTQQKLPFFSRQKPLLVPMRLRNQSFEIFRDAYNATEKNIKNNDEKSLDQIRNEKRHQSKKIGVLRELRDKQIQQFPLLCVLSETKKRTHVQKIKQRRESQNSNLERDQRMTEKIKTTIQTRTEAIKKLRQKDKNSMELVSKIWRQNFTRYGMAFSTFKISK